MVRILCKQNNKIVFNDLSDWTYNSLAYTIKEDDSGKNYLNKLSNNSNYRDIYRDKIFEIGKQYRVKFSLDIDFENNFVGGVYLDLGSTLYGPYTSVGEYNLLVNNPISTRLRIVGTTDTSKYSIRNLEITDLLGDDIDLNESELILITLQSSDVRDYSSRNGTYSKSFTVPGTNKNNKFFKEVFEINQEQRFNVNNRVDCDIFDDYLFFMSGYIQLNEIIDTRGQIEYNVTFFGNNLNLFSDVGEDELEDLKCTEMNHTATGGFVRSSWSFPNIPLNNSIVYPFIDYGQNEYNGGMIGLVGSAFDSSPSCGLVVSDLYPSIGVKYLWDKIFETYGYTYESSFLTGDTFSRLIIPFNRDEEDLYGYHLASDVKVEGEKSFLKKFSGDRNQNINSDYNEYSFGGNICSTQITLPYAEHLYYSNKWMKCHRDGIPSYYQQQGSVSLYLNTDNEVYRLFNYGPYIKSNYKPTGVTLLGQANQSNPNRYQSNLQLPGTFRVKTPGKYKIEVTYKLPTLTPVGALIPRFYVYAGKINISNIEMENIDNDILNQRWRIPDAPALNEINFELGQPYVGPEESYNITGLASGHTTPFSSLVTKSYEWENCEEGDLLYIKYFGINSNYIGDISRIRIYRYGWGEGCDLTYDQIIPKDFKIKDFMKNIIQMFNLYIDVDPEDPKKLIIEPRDSYYSSGNVQNWSQKIDIGQEIIYQHPTDFQNYSNVYRYSSDSDFHNKLFEDLKDVQKIGYGGKKFIYESDFVSEEKTTSLSFAPTVLRSEWRKKGPNNEYQFVNSTIWNSPYPRPDGPLLIQKKTTWTPRILLFNYIPINDNSGSVTKFNFDYVQDTSYPYAGHILQPFQLESTTNVDINFDTKLRYSRSWSKMFDGKPVTSMTKNNLWNMYHKKQFDQYTDPDSKLLTAYFRLTLNDIIKLRLNDLIFVNNSYFIINKIDDFNPNGKNLTKVELLKVDSNLTGDFDKFETNTTVIPVVPLDDQIAGITIGKYNRKKDNSGIVIGDDNFSNTNTLILGNFNYSEPNSAIINGNNNRVTSGSTIINSSNVKIIEGNTNVVAINTQDKLVTESNVTIIDSLKIKQGHILASDGIMDGGNIEIDGVFNNFKIKGYYINDCGLNGTQLEDINPYIRIDGGEV